MRASKLVRLAAEKHVEMIVMDKRCLSVPKVAVVRIASQGAVVSTYNDLTKRRNRMRGVSMSG